MARADPRRKWRESRSGVGAPAGRSHRRISYVAAGAVIAREVPAHALVAGVAAKLIGRVCRCGTRLVEEQASVWHSPRCGETFEEYGAEGLTSLAKSC